MAVGREEGREGVERMEEKEGREGREGSPTSELVVRFPPEVQAAIEAVLPSSDPLDQVMGRVDLQTTFYGQRCP